MRFNSTSSLGPPAPADAHMPAVHCTPVKRLRSETSTTFHPFKKQKRICTTEFLSPIKYERFSGDQPVQGALKADTPRNTSFSARPYRRQLFPTARRRESKWTDQRPLGVNDFYSLQTLPEVKRSARHGGPDLSDLRGYQQPSHNVMSQATTSSRSLKRQSSDASSAKSSKRPSPHNRNFQQKLIDGGVYPHAYKHPDGKGSTRPANWELINKALAQPRPSLSPSRFSDKTFERFVQADADAFKEKQVTTFVIPTIEGPLKDGKCVAGGVPLTNLEQLTDGQFAPGNTDHFYGARPEQLDRKIRDHLHHHIIPSTQDDLPMAPNFFLAVKGPDGSAAVMQKQACYDGALGSRGIHSLQEYGLGTAYDDCAYTLTSTYHDGQLKIFTSHPTKPQKAGEQPRYYMNQISGWSMTGNIGAFRQGATYFRNGRDLTEQWRNDFIDAANKKLHDEDVEKVSPSIESSRKENASTFELGNDLAESDTSQDEFHDTKE